MFRWQWNWCFTSIYKTLGYWRIYLIDKQSDRPQACDKAKVVWLCRVWVWIDFHCRSVLLMIMRKWQGCGCIINSLLYSFMVKCSKLLYKDLSRMLSSINKEPESLGIFVFTSKKTPNNAVLSLLIGMHRYWYQISMSAVSEPKWEYRYRFVNIGISSIGYRLSDWKCAKYTIFKLFTPKLKILHNCTHFREGIVSVPGIGSIGSVLGISQYWKCSIGIGIRNKKLILVHP